MPKQFIFINDPGHAWLVVPLAEVRASGADISDCSYIRGDTAFLEEDCDAGAFLNTLEAGSFEITEDMRDQFDIRENRAYRPFA